MSLDASLRQALQAALAQLLRPLARLMLRHALPYAAFDAVARKVFAEVAFDEFRIPGKKPSISRASILTGLTRKDVQRLLDDDDDAALRDASGERYNRAARVLTGWVRDAEFQDGRGRPLAIAIDGPGGFAQLVRRHSGDMPSRAVLDELLRTGAVRELADGRIALAERAYVPKGSTLDKLAILGRDTADLLATIDHNLQHGEVDPRFQRKVMYRRVPLDAVPAFRKLSAARAQALLEQLDRWFTEHTVDAEPGEPQARVGLGIHYFEEAAEAAPPIGTSR
jgi:hypothetical protein